MRSYNGERMSGKAAMAAAGIERVQLEAKEGLALNNGATFSAAIAALTSTLADTLIHTAEVATAASLEALLGASAAFDPRLHEARNQIGQIEVAARIRALTDGSTLLNAAGRVQDAYSLRCAPQVHGPVRDTLNFVWQIITREINAATDNPLIFGPGEAISGGNFHGEVIGMVMDYLKIALSELGAISERRTFHLTDVKMNAGLPAMLVDNPRSGWAELRDDDAAIHRRLADPGEPAPLHPGLDPLAADLRREGRPQRQLADRRPACPDDHRKYRPHPGNRTVYRNARLGYPHAG